MIYIKTPEQINKLKSMGSDSNKILVEAFQFAKAGVRTIDINEFIEKRIRTEGYKAWFKDIDGYPYGSCISVNEDWIHGMPDEYVLKDGDIVSIDIGLKQGGLYTDHCWTNIVGNDIGNALPEVFSTGNREKDKFLNVGVQSLKKAILEAKEGNRIGAISHAMQKEVEDGGFSVVEEYAGHGVGLHPHEDPIIPCFGVPNQGPVIKKGMVLAIESMYSLNSPAIKVLEDGWTVSTKDGGISGMFEHSVAITEKGPEILTI